MSVDIDSDCDRSVGARKHREERLPPWNSRSGRSALVLFRTVPYSDHMSSIDPNFMRMFERKYANLVQIDQSKCLQKLTCILAKNESSFEDPVIAHIVRDFESIKTIHSNSPAFPFLAAYQTGLSKQRCEKAYPECPIGFVADERFLDDEEEDVAGAVETDTSSATTASPQQTEDTLW